MTCEEVEALFEKHKDKFCTFEKVKKKRSRFADLHAFLLLEERFDNEEGDMVSAAEHDQIYLGIELEDDNIPLTEDDIIELARCGVRFDSDNGNGFVMFV